MLLSAGRVRLAGACARRRMSAAAAAAAGDAPAGDRPVLRAVARTTRGKREARHLRRRGLLPAQIYGKRAEFEPQEYIKAAVGTSDMARVLSRTQHAFQSTVHHVELVDEATGEPLEPAFPALFRDPLFHPTHEASLLSVNLMRFNLGCKVDIPLRLVNLDQSPGVRGGGTPMQMFFRLRCRAYTEHIPTSLSADMTGMKDKDKLYVSAIQFPEGIEPVHPEALVAIVKPGRKSRLLAAQG